MSRSNVARLLVSCRDREGIIATLSEALRDIGANIITPISSRLTLTVGASRCGWSSTSRTADERSQTLEHGWRTSAAVFELDYKLDRRKAAQARGAVRLHATTTACSTCSGAGVAVSSIWTWCGRLQPPRPAGGGRRASAFRTTTSRSRKDTKTEAEQAQLDLLAGEVDLVVMARYMQVLSADFLEQDRRAR